MRHVNHAGYCRGMSSSVPFAVARGGRHLFAVLSAFCIFAVG